jgi:predicted nucleotide-binding protein (sugar kinase/HSP70/actin superfamily)
MVKFVSFDCGEFSLKFVKDELICFVPVIMIKNDGVTQMHSIRKQIRDMEYILDNSCLHHSANILAKQDRRLL